MFRLRVPQQSGARSFYFAGESGPRTRPDGLATIMARSVDARPLPLERSGQQYFVSEQDADFEIEYELYLHPSALKPATWPNNHPYSLRWEDFAYIGGDAFLRSSDFHPHAADIVLHVPESWTIYAADREPIKVSEPWRTADLPGATLLMGLDLEARNGEGGVGILRIGTLPWADDDVLTSLAAMLEPLRRRGLAGPEVVYDFIIARYPGALRLNPLISGRAVGPHTFLHWVGVGSQDWWRKHTAADIAKAAIGRSLNLAPEASWFRAGAADYAGLLMLHEAQLLKIEDMYQSLRNMFVTASRYSGPSWPSLLMAGLSERESHAAERVLQFRSPIVAFLFDLELRERSAGAVTLLDWWATLAADGPEEVYNDDLLPPFHAFGDMSDFFLERVFASDRLTIDFEAAFERWTNFLPRPATP